MLIFPVFMAPFYFFKLYTWFYKKWISIPKRPENGQNVNIPCICRKELVCMNELYTHLCSNRSYRVQQTFKFSHFSKSIYRDRKNRGDFTLNWYKTVIGVEMAALHWLLLTQKVFDWHWLNWFFVHFFPPILLSVW